MGGEEEAAGGEEDDQEGRDVGCVVDWGASLVTQGGLGDVGGLPLHKSGVEGAEQTCQVVLGGLWVGEHLSLLDSTGRLQGSSSGGCG